MGLFSAATLDAVAARVAAAFLIAQIALAGLGVAAAASRTSRHSARSVPMVRAATVAALPAPLPVTAPAPPPAPPSPSSPPAPVVKALPPAFVPAAAPRESLPFGKGMWIFEPEATEGGNVAVIVARAKAAGLTHVWARTGSTWDGFVGAPFLARLLPAAHKAGLKVYGWDFPRLLVWQDDVNRALLAISYRTPGGHGLDGFAADIETASEGTSITGPGALAYGHNLRQVVGAAYPLIAVVPHPSPERLATGYPYADVVARFDAVAPMVYWLNREPGSDVERAMRILTKLGKPVFPIGQAYDGKAEGGRPGVPPPAELRRFMEFAARNGAGGVSFWVWQQTNQAAWETIRDAPWFRLSELLPGPLRLTAP